MRPRGAWTLAGAVMPGLLFAILLFVAWRIDPRFAWVSEPWRAPWPIWGVAIGGVAGLVGNVSDYRYHRRAPLVGEPEHKSHLLALLTGGVPLFFVMAAATFAARPALLVVPAIALVGYVVFWVAYDELVYHRRRRCKRVERIYHALSTIGNATALLSWAHWVFALGVGGAR